MKKASTLFFGLAVFIGLLWAGVEFVIYRSTDDPNVKMCRFTTPERAVSQQNLLGLEQQMLWTFDRAGEKVMRYRVTGDNGISKDPVDKGLEFRCQEPGYNCFLKASAMGFEKLNVFTFQNNVFMVDAQDGKNHSVFPVALINDKTALTSPLQMCGQAPEPHAAAYSLSTDRIIYFDAKRSLLGIWSLSGFQGSVTKAVAREPEQIFSVDSNAGFVRSNCQAKPSRVNATVQFEPDSLVLVADAQDKVDTSVFSLGATIEEKKEPSNLQKLGVNILKNTLSLAQFTHYDEKTLLVGRSRYFLAPLKLAMVRENESFAFADLDWSFKRSKIPFFLALEKNPHEGWLFLQKNDDIGIQEFKCDN